MKVSLGHLGLGRLWQIHKAGWCKIDLIWDDHLDSGHKLLAGLVHLVAAYWRWHPTLQQGWKCWKIPTSLAKSNTTLTQGLPSSTTLPWHVLVAILYIHVTHVYDNDFNVIPQPFLDHLRWFYSYLQRGTLLCVIYSSVAGKSPKKNSFKRWIFQPDSMMTRTGGYWDGRLTSYYDWLMCIYIYVSSYDSYGGFLT